jgi:hypothetical protein
VDHARAFAHPGNSDSGVSDLNLLGRSFGAGVGGHDGPGRGRKARFIRLGPRDYFYSSMMDRMQWTI